MKRGYPNSNASSYFLKLPFYQPYSLRDGPGHVSVLLTDPALREDAIPLLLDLKPRDISTYMVMQPCSARGTALQPNQNHLSPLNRRQQLGRNRRALWVYNRSWMLDPWRSKENVPDTEEMGDARGARTLGAGSDDVDVARDRLLALLLHSG
jgi:hypothetical protein